MAYGRFFPVTPYSERWQLQPRKHNWCDKDFFEAKTFAPPATKPWLTLPTPSLSGRVSMMLWPTIENHIYVKILMRKGLPKEIACLIVMPLVMFRRHFTWARTWEKGLEYFFRKMYRNYIYRLLNTHQFSSAVEHCEPHKDCIRLSIVRTKSETETNTDFMLHRPDCKRGTALTIGREELPLALRLVNLGVGFRSPEWSLRYEYVWIRRGSYGSFSRTINLHGSDIPIPNFLRDSCIWDSETQEAMELRVKCKGDIPLFEAMWKSLHEEKK